MEEKIEKLLEKIEKAKKGQVDLSLEEDLSVGLMNLLGIEEHFFFTGVKTGKGKYFDLLNEVRQMRVGLMKKLVVEPEGEIWCLSKHLLAATVRLSEVGTKYLGDGKKEEAEEMFAKAYQLYSLFWGLNLKLVDSGQVKKIEEGALNVKDKDKDTIFGKLQKVLEKILDCCKE